MHETSFFVIVQSAPSLACVLYPECARGNLAIEHVYGTRLTQRDCHSVAVVLSVIVVVQRTG